MAERQVAPERAEPAAALHPVAGQRIDHAAEGECQQQGCAGGRAAAQRHDRQQGGGKHPGQMRQKERIGHGGQVAARQEPAGQAGYAPPHAPVGRQRAPLPHKAAQFGAQVSQADAAELEGKADRPVGQAGQADGADGAQGGMPGASGSSPVTPIRTRPIGTSRALAAARRYQKRGVAAPAGAALAALPAGDCACSTPGAHTTIIVMTRARRSTSRRRTDNWFMVLCLVSEMPAGGTRACGHPTA